MKAIRIEKFGGPEVMELVDLPDPEPADGEVIVEVSRAGINFADTHATRNDYIAEQTLPMTPGAEVAGRTTDGRRVAAILATGGYAQRVAVPDSWLVPIPEEVTDDQAASLLLQGLTAHALVHRCAHLEPGETVVVQGAAGGTGLLAVQLAKRAGGRVIGLASTEEKRELAARLGADATVDSRAEDLGAAILEANDGRAGRRRLGDDRGLELRRSRSAPWPPWGASWSSESPPESATRSVPGHLLRHSRSVIGFWLMHLLGRRDEVGAMIGDLFAAVASGDLEVVVGGVYPLSEARRAHEELAGRRTSGKLLLDPAL